jgi:transcriptional regulator with XRE-family HTH domain
MVEISPEQLRVARVVAGLSQPQVARRLGLSKSTIARAERDKPCGLRTRQQLAALWRDAGVQFAARGWIHVPSPAAETM